MRCGIKFTVMKNVWRDALNSGAVTIECGLNGMGGSIPCSGNMVDEIAFSHAVSCKHLMSGIVTSVTCISEQLRYC